MTNTCMKGADPFFLTNINAVNKVTIPVRPDATLSPRTPGNQSRRFPPPLRGLEGGIQAAQEMMSHQLLR